MAHSRWYMAAPYGVKICFTSDRREWARRHGSKVEDYEDSLGLCAWVGDNKIAVGVFDDSLYTLVHEVTHAVLNVLESVGIDPISNKGECMAYLMDYLTMLAVQELDPTR